MHKIVYEVSLDEISSDIEERYFYARDFLYRILIVVIKDLGFEDIIIEENSYNGLLKMFNISDSMELIKEHVISFKYSLLFINLYEDFKLLISKIYRENLLVIVNVNIISLNKGELIVKYMRKRDGKNLYY